MFLPAFGGAALFEANMLKNPQPVHPGKIIAQIYLPQMGWTQAKLAEEVGCAQRKVSEIIDGKSAISADFAIDLELVLGTEAELWVRLQGEYDLDQARKKRAGYSQQD